MSAGLVAGIVSAALLYPLENLETRQQLATTTKEKVTAVVGKATTTWWSLARTVYLQEGCAGFYRGALPAIVGTGVNWMLYSALYAQFVVWCPLWYSSVVGGVGGGGGGVGGGVDVMGRDIWTDFFAGCLTGMVTSLLVNPLWVLKVRLAAVESVGVVSTLRKMIREEGLLSLWSGSLVSMFGCLEGAIQFLLVEEAKRRRTNGMVVVGSFARVLSVTLCYPYQSIRSIQQSSRKGFVWSRDFNMSSLYAGWLIKMFRELLFGGIFTMIRETMLREE